MMIILGYPFITIAEWGVLLIYKFQDFHEFYDEGGRVFREASSAVSSVVFSILRGSGNCFQCVRRIESHNVLLNHDYNH